MWIVRLALRRTYTFVVVGPADRRARAGSASTGCRPTSSRTSTSRSSASSGSTPACRPTRSSPRIILINERVLTTSVNDIEHIESQSLDGVGVIRIYFYPGAAIAEAEAQVTATMPGAPQDHAARHHAAVHRPLQRHQRADPADRRQQRHADRAADLRLRHELRHPADSAPSRGPACRSRGAASSGRSWSTSTRTSCTPAASRPTTCQRPSATRT